mgnify:FL=1
MNRSVRTKLTALGLCVTLMFTALTGCGNKDTKETLSTEQQSVTEVIESTENVTEAGNEVTEGASEENPVTFTDALGRDVTVTSHDRVAAMIGSFADVWLLSGGELVATANESWESLDLDLGDDVVNLGSIQEPNTEALLAVQPDLVIASTNTTSNVEMENMLTEAGVTVAYFDVSNFEQYLNMLDKCTMITGRRDLYKTNGTDVKEQIDTIKSRVDGSNPKILFIRTSSSSVKAKQSEGSVGGEILKDLGCVNIADSDTSLLDDLSLEAIVVADPDYIFVTTQGNDTDAAIRNIDKLLTSNPAWSSLTAVKQGRYYVLDKKLYNLKPNAKWGEAYKQLADILYIDR